MLHQIGDHVVHWNYGSGVIVGMDEKELAGVTRLYYVVEVSNSTLWVPADEGGERSLRTPLPGPEFQELLKTLNEPAEPLIDNQYQRQGQLNQRMHERTLADICSIIRDLTARSRAQRLNRNDLEILKNAENLLLTEWELSLGTPRATAASELSNLLKAI